MFVNHYPNQEATSLVYLKDKAIEMTTQLYTQTGPNLVRFLQNTPGTLTFEGRGLEQVANEIIITARFHLPDRMVNGIGAHRNVNIFVDRTSYIAFSNHICFYFASTKATLGSSCATATHLELVQGFFQVRELFSYLMGEWDNRNGKGGKRARVPSMSRPELSF